jgi:HEAT repeat protein
MAPTPLERSDHQIVEPDAYVPYASSEDHRYQELLKANGLLLSQDALLTVLQDEASFLKAPAAHVAGALGYEAAVPILKKRAAGSADDLLKVEAAFALVRLGQADAKRTLIECLRYRLDAYICPAVAAGYLARLGDSRGFGVVTRALGSDNSAVRMLACKQLFFFLPFQGSRYEDAGQIDVYALYARALRDPSSSVAWEALIQLREVRSTAVRVLEEFAAETRDAALKQGAQEILAMA